MLILGGLMMNTTDCSFYDLNHHSIKLTPMQMQLMRMFFTAANHKISKHEICTTLWPKKPDASETLYTLIRRLKPIVEKNGNLEIVSERGKDYQLRIRR
jgi:DNA-binding winged helix-turn-helix (wHTH) protein